MLRFVTFPADKLTGPLAALDAAALINLTAANLVGLVPAGSLPLAAAGTRGAIRIGTGLAIDGNGIVSVDAASSTGLVKTGSAGSPVNQTIFGPTLARNDVNTTYYPFAIANMSVGTNGGVGIGFTLADTAGGGVSAARFYAVKTGAFTSGNLASQTSNFILELQDGATTREGFRIVAGARFILGTTVDDGVNKLQVTGPAKITGAFQATGVLTLGSGNLAVSNAAGNLLASALTGALPALDGSALTSLSAGNLVGTIPNAVVLPTASTTQLGGVKVDGTTITIAGGVISAAGGGGGASLSAINYWTANQRFSAGARIGGESDDSPFTAGSHADLWFQDNFGGARLRMQYDGTAMIINLPSSNDLKIQYLGTDRIVIKSAASGRILMGTNVPADDGSTGTQVGGGFKADAYYNAPLNLPFFGQGKPVAGGIYQYPVTVPFTMPTTGHSAFCYVTGTVGTATWTVRRSGINIGNVTFTTGQNTGTVNITASGATLNFNAGDTLELVAPNPQNATLADWGIAFKGVTR